MNDCDLLLGATGVVALAGEALRDAPARIGALPLADLLRGWRVVQTTGYPDETPAIRAFGSYFDSLGQRDPDRCVAFLDVLVRQEPSDEIVAQAFDGKLVSQLATFSLAEAATRLEQVATGSERWSRMLGAAHWAIRDAAREHGLGEALLAIADRSAFEAWDTARKENRPAIDVDVLTLPEIARWWVALNAASPVERSRDDNVSKLFDFQWDLANQDPDRGLALVLEVLAICHDPTLLGLLAASLLEDCVPGGEGPLLDRVVAIAEGNPRFRRLLARIYTSGFTPEAVARLEAVTDRSPGPI